MKVEPGLMQVMTWPEFLMLFSVLVLLIGGGLLLAKVSVIAFRMMKGRMK